MNRSFRCWLLSYNKHSMIQCSRQRVRWGELNAQCSCLPFCGMVTFRHNVPVSCSKTVYITSIAETSLADTISKQRFNEWNIIFFIALLLPYVLQCKIVCYQTECVVMCNSIHVHYFRVSFLDANHYHYKTSRFS